MSDSIDWAKLAQSVADYDLRECADGLEDAVFSSLYLKTSTIHDLVAKAYGGPAASAPILSIFADTLIVDDPLLPTANLTIVARKLVLGDSQTPIRVSAPDATRVSSTQILTRNIIKGPLSLISGESEPWNVTVDGEGPTVITFVRGADSSDDESSTSKTKGSVLDMVRHPMAWNTLKATFEGAAVLIEQGAEAVSEGISMLQWIYSCTNLIAAESRPLQAEAQDLAYQSAALLVLVGGQASAPYVPKLSQSFYKDRISGLLSVVTSYEAKSDALQTQEDIEQAVKDISGTLGSISQTEGVAIQVSIKNTQDEATALLKQYDKLLDLYNHQQNDIKLKQIIFKHGLEEKKIWDTVSAVIGAIEAVVAMAGAVGALAVAPEASPEVAEGAAKGAEAAAKSAEAAAKAAETAKAASSAWSQLAAGVSEIKKLQDKIGKLLSAGASLFKAAKGLETTVTKGTSGPNLTSPDWAEIATTDPALQWNLFAAKVEDALKSSVDSNVDGAKDYLNSLRILIEYGKSMNTKAVALARLEGHSLELRAQADAAEFAQQRWNKLSDASATTLQKQAALQALLSQHLVNAKRSLFICAKGFAAAYFYRYLVQPTFQFSVTMTSLELTTQCAQLQRGIEQLLTDAPPDQSFDTGYFMLPVIKSGDPSPTQGEPNLCRVLLNIDGPKPTLTWSVPLLQPPFQGTVPDDTTVGVFIEEAWFYLHGVKPNKSGAVMLMVSTSGAYGNGYGLSASSFRFVSPSFGMDFIYKPTNAGEPALDGGGEPIPPSTPWKPADPQFYLNPSPFTEWLAVVNGAGDLDGITGLSMRLTGVYHHPADADSST